METLIQLLRAFEAGDESAREPIHDLLIDMGYPHVADAHFADPDEFGNGPCDEECHVIKHGLHIEWLEEEERKKQTEYRYRTT